MGKLKNAHVATLGILIQDIPHREQRYNTCGDYFEEKLEYSPELGGYPTLLHVKVSKLPSRREMFLVAIHELIELALCEAEGIGIEEIDRFDMQEGMDIEGIEPGDHPDAPYYKQHQIASGIERILAAEMGVDWLTYERHIAELDYSKPVEPLTYDDDIPF